MYVCVCTCIFAGYVSLGGSENHFMKFVISFNLYVGSSDQTQIVKLVLQVVFPVEPSL